MFERGDFINAVPPADYGEWTCLMFTEDAQMVHGNHLKYMGKVRPVCQTYKETPENQRNLLCNSCRHQCPQKKYMVKYVGDFAHSEAQRPPETRTGDFSAENQGAADTTRNQDLETLLRREKLRKTDINGTTVNRDAVSERQRPLSEDTHLQFQRTLLYHQAEMNIVSPFLMQTITSGEEMCGEVPVFFTVLELAEGRELGEYIAAIHNLSDKDDMMWRCLDLIRQLLLAVRAYSKTYSNGYYVHRDLKPANIMVKIERDNNDVSFQQLKIIDFDMLVRQNHIEENRVYMGGTIGYVHPEAYRLRSLPEDTRRQFSHRWDLYAVGLIMYEIMEGHPYFDDDARTAYLSDPEMAYVLNMGEDSETEKEYPELVEIIRRLLSNTAEGYTDIDQVIEDYQQFLELFYPKWYGFYYMRNWLECGHDFDKSLAFCRIYCHVSSEGLKDVRQNFCVNANSVVPLIYGKNIIGVGCLSDSRILKKEIGAFYFILRPDRKYALKYIALNENCRVSGMEDGNLAGGAEISFADVKIVIDRIIVPKNIQQNSI